MLGCDWGTTALRVYAVDGRGGVLERRDSELGMLAARGIGFEQALRDTAGDWLVPERLVLLAGMVGAHGGWLEAPYCPCPAGLAEIASSMCRVSTNIARVFMVPGVCMHAAEPPEVMRGEETQLLGVLAGGGGDGTYVMPGTHTKWVEVAAGRITALATYMTGEVFQAVRDHTVLRDLLPPMGEWDWDGAGFRQGVRVGAAAPAGGDLLNRLFGVRTHGLFDGLPAAQLGPYLSGLLLGAEIQAAAGAARWPVTVVGADCLVAKYNQAGAELGRKMKAADADVAIMGLVALADTLKLGN